MSTTHSVLLYGAEVWVDVLGKDMYHKRLAQVQKWGALWVSSASESAVMILGVISVVLAKKRKTIHKYKEDGCL